jgi:hypothetical protein
LNNDWADFGGRRNPLHHGLTASPPSAAPSLHESNRLGMLIESRAMCPAETDECRLCRNPRLPSCFSAFRRVRNCRTSARCAPTMSSSWSCRTMAIVMVNFYPSLCFRGTRALGFRIHAAEKSPGFNAPPVYDGIYIGQPSSRAKAVASRSGERRRSGRRSLRLRWSPYSLRPLPGKVHRVRIASGIRFRLPTAFLFHARGPGKRGSLYPALLEETGAGAAGATRIWRKYPAATCACA